MCRKLIIRAANTTNQAHAAPQFHKIHTPQPPSAPIGATPEPYSSLTPRWFGLKSSPHLSTAPIPPLPPLTAGQIILLTGPSGSGKSTLLRRLRRRCKFPITD